MAATSDDNDLRMNGRLARAYVDPANKEWSAAFFDSGTHAGHGDPAERLRHERHVAAVEQLQNDIAQDHAAAQYRAGLANQTGSSVTQIQLEIQRAQENPAFGNGRHRDHAAQVEYVGSLYRKLAASR